MNGPLTRHSERSLNAGRGRMFVPLVIAAMLSMTMHVCATAPDSYDRESKVKAAYLLNFVKFCKWPQHAFDDQEHNLAPIVIVILGSGADDTASVLDVMVGERAVQNRKVVVRRAEYPDAEDPTTRRRQVENFERELRAAHLLYIDSSFDTQIPAILDTLSSVTLTVSDGPGFTSRGGMIGLVRDNGKVVFEANPDVIEKSDVSLSSTVLRLARIVSAKERRE